MVHEYHFWNLPHFFRNLAGNIYISFLLLLLKLRFTCAKENFSEWSKVPKYYDHGGRFRNGTHGPWNVFSNKKHFFWLLDCEIHTRFSSTVWFSHFSIILSCLKKLEFIEFYTKFWINKTYFWYLNVLSKLPVFFKRYKLECMLYGLIEIKLLLRSFTLR